MAGFTGSMELKIIEAVDLMPAENSTRNANSSVTKTLDPYVSVDVDDTHVFSSQSKGKTFRPVWNETMSSELDEAQSLTLTVFHDASIPPDDFVANCTIPFEELHKGANKDGKNETWLDLEPQGKIHIIMELRETASAAAAKKKPKEFKERAGLNKRRGSSKRRVHQINGHKFIATFNRQTTLCSQCKEFICGLGKPSVQIESVPKSNCSCCKLIERSSEASSEAEAPEDRPAPEDKPAPGEKPTPEDKPISRPPSPASMATAFTITFDDEYNGKKALKIKDSIRKFAPRKPDSIEKPRPQNVIEKLPVVKKPPLRSRSKVRNPEASLITKDTLNGNISDSAAYLIQRMLCSEPANSGADEMAESEGSSKESVSEPSSPAKEAKDIPLKGAASPLKSPSTGGRDSGVCDDKSESGTYTVGAERTDPVVEEARNKIDEVFGVRRASNPVNGVLAVTSSTSPQAAAMAAARAFWLNHYSPTHQISSPKTPPSSSSTVANSGANSPNFWPQDYSGTSSPTATFTRAKHRQLPTPPDLDINESETRGRKLMNLQIETHLNGNLNIASNSTGCLWVQKGSPGSLPRDPSSNPESPSVQRKVANKPPIAVKTNSYRDIRKETDHSNSDVDFDHYEANSVKSDESAGSTEPSSVGSFKCKSDTNAATSGLRFNRAFALRRARLGIETPGVPLNLSKDKPKKQPENSRESNLSRNDGGRFSLRLPRTMSSTRKAPANSLTSSNASSKEDIRKPQRKLSDQLINSVNRLSTRPAAKSTQSDSEQPKNRRNFSPASGSSQSNPIQRSSSFGDPKSAESGYKRTDSNNLKGMQPFQVTKRIFSTKPHQMAQMATSVRKQQASVVPTKRETIVMSTSLMESKDPKGSPDSSCSPTFRGRSSRELSALDNLVVSAIHQLSHKLRSEMRALLEKERLKYPIGSETRLMVEEILPQVASPEKRLLDTGENTTSKDLSNILKNLKKVEQSLEVLSLINEPLS